MCTPTFSLKESAAAKDVSKDTFDPQRSDEQRKEQVEMRQKIPEGSFLLIFQRFPVHFGHPNAGPRHKGAEKSRRQRQQHLEGHLGDVRRTVHVLILSGGENGNKVKPVSSALGLVRNKNQEPTSTSKQP